MGLLIDRRRCYIESLAPLKLTVEESAKITFTLTVAANYYDYLEYSIDDGETWVRNVYGGPSSIETPVIEAGSSVFFRGMGARLGNLSNTSGIISCDSSFAAEGSLMSLLGKSHFLNGDLNNGAFFNLFKDSKVTDASRLMLPSKMKQSLLRGLFESCTLLESAPKMEHIHHLESYCFSSMYAGCSSLRGAVKLNATTLANDCCTYMYKDSGIEEIELPATELATRCYNFMMNNCRSLKKIKCMALANIGSTSYTSRWVQGVPSGGTFIKNSAAEWENVFGISGIPSGWTVETANN